jgi:hypothetical protein
MKRTGSGSELGRTRLAVRACAALVGAALLPLVTFPAVSSATASSCQALVVNRVGEPSASSVLVTMPTALLGQQLLASDFTVWQRVEPVPVRSVQRLPASRVDVAIVLDTAASVPDEAVARAQRLAASLLRNLPPDVRVAAVSGGGSPTVISGLSQPRAHALQAVREAGRSDGHAGADAVARAGGLLAADADRSRHVVLVSTGSDDASKRDIGQVRTTLDARGISLHPVSVRGSLEPSWGGQCPPPVRAGQEAAAGSLLASRVSETYEIVAPRADPSVPMTVRARSGPVDASAQLAVLPAGKTAVRGTKIEGPGSAGSEQRALWILAGLLALSVALGLGLVRLSPSLPGHSARSRSSWFPGTRTIVLPPRPRGPTSPPAPPDHRDD